MGKYDVVIIGSGLGGLVCGYILSKFGYKVCILEQHTQIGGCLQTFRRSGVTFDTGMHYIGSLDPGQVLHTYFSYLGLLDTVPVRRLDESGFDTISLPQGDFKIPMGFSNFVEGLSAQFPHERNNIETYVQRIREVALESPLYNIQEIHEQVFLNPHSVKSGVQEFMCGISPNTVLQNVLLGNIPLYAGQRDKTPLYIHALIHNFYIQSAYRLVGGSDSISNSLAASIQVHGGEIYTKSQVAHIHCNAEKAVSVELSNGEIIHAESFISNMHPEATLAKLNTPLIRKAYRERILNLENTISNFTVYIVFKKNTVPYLNTNYYRYNTSDVWECTDYTPQSWPMNFLYMHQAPANNSKFAEGALLIAYMKYDEVRQWEHTTIGKRGDDYKAFKQEKSEKLLNALEQSFPGIRSGIESYSSSTPLTYRDYTATKEGSMYGVVRDKNFPTQTLVSQRTRIPNLFMTGQNINSHGILGVTIGSIITCSEFLGINTIIKDIKQHI
ncbi:MAG: hypothetical protein BWY22_02195 [Bacteroidetes bacterium ADurb.Bin217]|nr:MAG: hypothetical protein BWY22_02195 [Bacteroidetes bacterium ADurb.Bin217]